LSSGLRYLMGNSWAERKAKADEDLASLREHRGYHALTDMLEGELRALWSQWLRDDIDQSQAAILRLEAQLLHKLIVELEGITSEKDLQEMQTRQYQGFTDDANMEAAIASHMQSAGQSPAGEGVY